MKESYTLAQLADCCSARLRGDSEYRVTGINTLQDAQDNELSFLSADAYSHLLKTTQAGVVVLSTEHAEHYDGNVLILDNPYLGYAKLSFLFCQDKHGSPGVHPSAVVHSDAIIHQTASIAANVVIEAGVHIDKNVRVESGVFVGKNSVLRADVYIHRNVTICHGVLIGERTIIHPGAVIGSDGFGNAYCEGRWHKIAQLGGVVVGSDVEIGSNTCVDRGSLGNTEIRDGVRLDNLIQIAHNVVIGENTAIAASVAIAGSAIIGKNCTIGGAAGINGHVTIADNTHITGMAMITRSISKGGTYSSGTGFMEARSWRKSAIRFRQLDDLAKRLDKLEKT